MEVWTHKLFFSTDMIISELRKKGKIYFAPNIKLKHKVLQMQVARKGKIREKQNKARKFPAM